MNHAKPAGSLLMNLATMRRYLFPELVRRRPDGSEYIGCDAPECEREALPPLLSCPLHVAGNGLDAAAKLEQMDPLPAHERRRRAFKGRVESRARYLAAQQGDPHSWFETEYMTPARQWVDDQIARRRREKHLDDVV